MVYLMTDKLKVYCTCNHASTLCTNLVIKNRLDCTIIPTQIIQYANKSKCNCECPPLNQLTSTHAEPCDLNQSFEDMPQGKINSVLLANVIQEGYDNTF